MPDIENVDKDHKWKERQEEMEQWYKDLIPDIDSTVSILKHDYLPLGQYFSKLIGHILDIGGGVGLVRQYLLNDSKLIVVDPSLDWLGSDWSQLSKTFPCLEKRPDFVLGLGEYLMFKNQSFDTVLSLWSMNHVSNPSRVFQEVQRVLKTGGKFFVVFEDMEPSWADILSRSRHRKIGCPTWLEILKMKLQVTFSKKFWPLQSDHLLITESDINIWIGSHFRINERKWYGNYLSFEFIKM
ncbi:class I SAM-dependent methyltransferase [Cognataquiflexum rubidum]|uniref:class I SAM-dependent methyltransferase n=1 Tax=Cognataquiflexum rubidum TaxID=2922273 RepID=UPI001F13B69F|nr:class I SAM-dependent methyltransferase [Cognataquiflexum rubidum]MCH6234049.1 class I SAM-dependent methyltransferase [Cognataquiflexum rubidum]